MEMWAAVPAKDEEKTILHVIQSCLGAGLNRVLVVINGSRDRTETLVRELGDTRVRALVFEEPLGVDVPRAISALEALRGAADSLLFCDGDLSGPISKCLAELAGTMAWGYDLALTDCYPKGLPGTGLAAQVLKARRLLNEGIGRADLGVASMSHGPSCVSRKFLQAIPLQALAIPPLAQALAVKKGLIVKIGSSFDHRLLGAREKDISHAESIAECIMGDSVEALETFHNKSPTRIFEGAVRIGAASARRWDILERYLNESLIRRPPPP
ncbi:MAG TPA: glycosyltransferase [Firmicutes bacterium]|nr:glycosyltransferase [Candidatus Fermentithermobacillaceae bacterium]